MEVSMLVEAHSNVDITNMGIGEMITEDNMC